MKRERDTERERERVRLRECVCKREREREREREIEIEIEIDQHVGDIPGIAEVRQGPVKIDSIRHYTHTSRHHRINMCSRHDTSINKPK